MTIAFLFGESIAMYSTSQLYCVELPSLTTAKRAPGFSCTVFAITLAFLLSNPIACVGQAPQSQEWDLVWFRHEINWDAANKREKHTLIGPKLVGTEFRKNSQYGYSSVFPGGDGNIFAIGKPYPEGTIPLWHYQHYGRDTGAFCWKSTSGSSSTPRELSIDDAQLLMRDKVFSGGGRSIYTIDKGTLRWYRRPDGLETNWETVQIELNPSAGYGIGFWKDYASVFPGGDGIIYAITNKNDKEDARLVWFRHNGRDDGSNRWENEGKGCNVTPEGTEWGSCQKVFAGGGFVYAVDNKGKLHHPAEPTDARRFRSGG